MLDILMDAFLDTIKLLPFLLLTFIILEFLEHKFSKKSEKILIKNQKYDVLLGGLLGGLPQCGFSSMASSLFANKVITIGTLIAIFLSTSDEMIPIMISENADVTLLLKVVLFKIVIGIIAGYIIDFVYKNKKEKLNNKIHNMCEKEKCSCEKRGIIVSSIIHALKIGLFIFIVNFVLNTLITEIGEDNLGNLLLNKNIFTYFLSSLIGLIPNCASSVIITELYLSNLITIGTLLSGLLTGSGLGILLLFKTNKNLKENIIILSIIYFIGVFIGIIVDLII